MTEQSKDYFGDIAIADEFSATPSPSPLPQRPKPRPIKLKYNHKWLYFIVPAALFICYLFVGYVLLPYLVGTVLPNHIAKAINLPVSVSKTEFDPFDLTLTMHNGVIGPDPALAKDQEKPTLSFGLMRVKFAAATFFSRGYFSKQTDIDNLFLHLVRSEDGNYNLIKIMPQFSVADKQAKPFSLNNIDVTNGRLIFDDLPAKTTHTVENIVLKLPSLANVNRQINQYIRPQFSATVNGSPLQLTGETKVTEDGLTANLSLQLQKFDLAENFAYLPSFLNCKVVKGEADLNLSLLFTTGNKGDTSLQLEGTGTGNDIWLNDKKGRELARLPKLTFSGSTAPLTGSFHIKELKFDRPTMLIERTGADKWALARINIPSHVSGRVDQIRVNNGKLTFLDRAVDGGFSDTWQKVQLHLKFPPGNPGRSGDFNISGIDKTGETIALHGTIKTNPLYISSRLTTDKLNLTRFSSYLENPKAIIIKNGQVHKLQTRLTVKSDKKSGKTSIAASDCSGQLHNLTISQENIDRLTIPQLALNKVNVDITGKTIHFGTAQSDQGELHISLVTPPTSQEDKPAKPARLGWNFELDQLKIANAQLLIDQGGAPVSPLQINNLDIRMQREDSPKAPARLLKVTGLMADKGSFAFDGPLADSAPYASTLNTTATNIRLASIAPLFGRGLQLKSTDGLVSCKGVLSLPSLLFTGDAQLDKYVAVNQEGAETIRWQKAAAKGLRFQPQPLSIKAEQLDIDHPIVALRLQPDRSSELTRLLQPTAYNSGQPVWEIQKLAVTEGIALVKDSGVTPPFISSISNIKGAFENFTDRVRQPCRISLQGMVDNADPASLTGTANLFHPDEDRKFEGEIKNFTVSRLSPYLAPHLGNQLTGGKMALQTTYRQQKKKVTGNGHLEIDDLSLGSKTGNGMKLPLAVALITDPKMRITLDLPVSGEHGDKDFSFRQGLVRGLRNLLLKTAVTPTALLSEINNGAPPATKLTFDAGKDLITDQGNQQLAELGKIMQNRPLLAISLSGYADSKSDRDALRKEQELKIAAQKKLEEQEKATKTAKELPTTTRSEEITTTPIGPTDDSPAAPDYVPPVVIDDLQLQALAEKRGRAVYDHLLKTLKIAPERLRLTAQSMQNAVTANMSGAGKRVEFTFTTLSKSNGK